MKEQIREILMNETFNITNEAGNSYEVIEVSDFTKIIHLIENLKVEARTNSLLIAMLESQLKVEKSVLETVKFKGAGIDYAITSAKIEELERQLSELKG